MIWKFALDLVLSLAAIAKEALATGGSVYQLVLQKGWLTKEALDDILRLAARQHCLSIFSISPGHQIQLLRRRM